MNTEEIKTQQEMEPTSVPAQEPVANTAADATIPSGYINIERPKNMRIYAPEKFHARNLDPEDLLGMALSDDEMLPIRTIDIFNDLIYESDIDIGEFTDKEIVLLLRDLYCHFVSNIIKDHPYRLQPSDYEYLAETLGGEESEAYKKKIRSYKSRKWSPKIDIDLSKIEVLKLPEDFKPILKVARKSTGFTCKYKYPTYGDIKVVKEFLDITFQREDEDHQNLASTLKYREDQLSKRDDGQDIPYESIPDLSKRESQDWDEYTYNRNLTLMKAIRAKNLVEYRGKDVSNLNLAQKLEIAADPEFDINIYQAISKAIDNTPIGLAKTIKVISPVTNKEIDYPFQFKVFDMLQAIQTTEADDIEVSYN